MALSDDSGMLARPWQTLSAGRTATASAAAVADLLDAMSRDALDEPRMAGVVVGLPRRLNGEDTSQTAAARALAAAIAARTGLPVHLQDERLTSREAEARLAERERDWRERKKRIDAVAAAIILQDFLDSRSDIARAAEDTTA